MLHHDGLCRGERQRAGRHASRYKQRCCHATLQTSGIAADDCDWKCARGCAGVSVSGQEGMQAVKSSGVTMLHFRHLESLLTIATGNVQGAVQGWASAGRRACKLSRAAVSP